MVRKTSSSRNAVLCLVVSVTFYMSIPVVLAQLENQTAELSKQNGTPGTQSPSSHTFSNSTGNVAPANKNKQFSSTTAASHSTVPDVTQQYGSTVVKTSKVVHQSTTENVITSSDTQSNGSDSQSTAVNKPDETMSTASDGAHPTQPSGSELASQSTAVNKPDETMTTASGGAHPTQPSGSELASQSTAVNKPDETMTTASGGAHPTQPSGSELASQSTAVNKPDETMTTASGGAHPTQPSGSELASQSTAVNKPDETMTTASGGAHPTQPSGSELASQSTAVNKPDKTMTTASDVATVAQPSVLDTSATAEVFLQSDIKIVAKPAVEDGHFIIYLIVGSILLSVVYIMYHNKNKIVSLCQKDGPKRTRRPKTSEYQRLDQNLSEVITSLKKKTNFKMS
ncbi:keratinocyte-associated transmembrane protein 2-like [Pristis pectinata]|uniref:keratinocyte-associated transmembrane protein 2-like n=1 Tax=Pristis pectinata TaxID=685728 RepID=UPI00223E0BC5|nr:keratinocyte-associated transmembrane protein 2-like [Pristis pectinata]